MKVIIHSHVKYSSTFLISEKNFQEEVVEPGRENDVTQVEPG